MKKNICLTTVLLFLSVAFNLRPAAAMNDTDGVIARGLFPLLGTHKYLQILSEDMTVTLTPKGIRSKRSHRIRNNGNSWTFRIGTICRYNDVSPSAWNCGSVRIDGTLQKLQTGTAHLVDKGEKVEIRPMSRDKIAKCIETVDGTICGHVWAYFETDIQNGEVKNLEFEYTDPIHSRASHEFSRQFNESLVLYTEKFWAGIVVPEVTVRFGVEGQPLQSKSFEPRGEFAHLYVKPDGAENGMIVWRFKNYKPDKHPYTYSFRVTVASAIEVHNVLNAYEKSLKRSTSPERK